MNTNPNDALDTALASLGFNEETAVFHRSNLLRAIYAFATATDNDGLAHACEARLNLLFAEADASARRS